MGVDGANPHPDTPSVSGMRLKFIGSSVRWPGALRAVSGTRTEEPNN
jgi:hypothetical protein